MDWEALYRSFAGDVLRVCYLLTRNRALAEDVCHEVFVRCMARNARMAPGKEKAYLMKAAVNRCRDEFRSARHKTRADLREAEHMARAGDRMNDVLREVLELPEDLRAVVVLHDYQGFTLAEAADMLRIPPGTAATRLSRARERPRSALKEYGA